MLTESLRRLHNSQSIGCLGTPEALLAAAAERCGQWHAPIPDLVTSTEQSAVTGHPVWDRAIPSGAADGAGFGRADVGSRVTVIGDAAHPMSPFKGQVGTPTHPPRHFHPHHRHHTHAKPHPFHHHSTSCENVSTALRLNLRSHSDLTLSDGCSPNSSLPFQHNIALTSLLPGGQPGAGRRRTSRTSSAQNRLGAHARLYSGTAGGSGDCCGSFESVRVGHACTQRCQGAAVARGGRVASHTHGACAFVVHARSSSARGCQRLRDHRRPCVGTQSRDKSHRRRKRAFARWGAMISRFMNSTFGDWLQLSVTPFALCSTPTHIATPCESRALLS
jgi:hypothetical protein